MEDYERLEQTAYILSEELGFEVATAQEAFNEVLQREEGKPSFHYFRGNARERLKNAGEMYEEARAVLDLADELGLEYLDEEREEEVRLMKERWYDRGSHDYTGSIGDAMDAHVENQEEARNSEILSHGTGYHALRTAVMQYEQLASQIDNFRPDFMDLEYEDIGDRHGGMLLEVDPEENPDEAIDLTEEFFSKTI
jgi:hypothetical protein